MKNIDNPNGIHYLIEFFGCKESHMESIDFWKKTLTDSVKETSIEILHDYFYKFKPQGITGFLLLSSSHISIHTWPDRRYIACDIFTCAGEKETNLILEKLKKKIFHKHISVKKVNRGYQFLNLPIFCNGEKMKMEIKSILHQAESDFQKIVIVDSLEYGKCLIIDGVMQTAESDHKIYDQEMLKLMRKRDKNILILGGGDGYIAQMAIKKNPELKIEVIDLDIEVIQCAKKFLDQKVFDNNKIKLFIGDALHFLKMTDKKYDGIICDLTDSPIGTKKEEKEFMEFYKKIIALANNKLNNGGWISVQGGASRTAKEFVNEAKIIKDIMKNYFRKLKRSDLYIPSYGESCAFLFGQK